MGAEATWGGPRPVGLLSCSVYAELHTDKNTISLFRLTTCWKKKLKEIFLMVILHLFLKVMKYLRDGLTLRRSLVATLLTLVTNVRNIKNVKENEVRCKYPVLFGKSH